MRIFINSRGFGEQADYHWHEMTSEAEQCVGIPEAYHALTYSQLIYAEDQSVLLARVAGELWLLITGLVSEQRRDFLNRPIHDSLLLLGDAGDESSLRGLVAGTLADARWLPMQLDQAITFDSRQGFATDWSKL